MRSAGGTEKTSKYPESKLLTQALGVGSFAAPAGAVPPSSGSPRCRDCRRNNHIPGREQRRRLRLRKDLDGSFMIVI